MEYSPIQRYKIATVGNQQHTCGMFLLFTAICLRCQLSLVLFKGVKGHVHTNVDTSENTVYVSKVFCSCIFKLLSRILQKNANTSGKSLNLLNFWCKQFPTFCKKCCVLSMRKRVCLQDFQQQITWKSNVWDHMTTIPRPFLKCFFNPIKKKKKLHRIYLYGVCGSIL